MKANPYIIITLMSLIQTKGVCAGIKRTAVYQPGSYASGEQPHQGKWLITLAYWCSMAAYKFLINRECCSIFMGDQVLLLVLKNRQVRHGSLHWRWKGVFHVVCVHLNILLVDLIDSPGFQVHMCRSKVSTRSCVFYNNCEGNSSSLRGTTYSRYK